MRKAAGENKENPNKEENRSAAGVLSSRLSGIAVEAKGEVPQDEAEYGQDLALVNRNETLEARRKGHLPNSKQPRRAC